MPQSGCVLLCSIHPPLRLLLIDPAVVHIAGKGGRKLHQFWAERDVGSVDGTGIVGGGGGVVEGTEHLLAWDQAVGR